MKSKKGYLYLICYYSYLIINVIFITYLSIYVLFLKDDSIYYKYLMILITGVFLGFAIATRVYRYLIKFKKMEDHN